MFQFAEQCFCVFFFLDFCCLILKLTGKTCPHGNFAVTVIVCFTATIKPVLNGPPVKQSTYNRQILAAKIHLLSLAYVHKNKPALRGHLY